MYLPQVYMFQKRSKKSIRYLGGGVLRSHELLDMGARNESWVPWESIEGHSPGPRKLLVTFKTYQYLGSPHRNLLGSPRALALGSAWHLATAGPFGMLGTPPGSIS